MDGRLRWIYERIHFDPKPIDIAIVGPSQVQLGLSAAAIEEDLAQQRQARQCRQPRFPGRRTRHPMGDRARAFQGKIAEGDRSRGRGPALPLRQFRLQICRAGEAIVFPPTPFLHNYLYNLAYLPIRKLTLFGADLFPGLFGLSKQFDPERYAQSRTDYSTSFIGDLGKLVDMEHPVPRATLLAEPRDAGPPHSRRRAS